MFVLPTLEDAFALVVFETRAAGLLVIATDHAGACEAINDSQDAFVVPAGDVDALAEAIAKIVASPDLRRSLGAAAREKVAGGYSWNEYEGRVMAVIDARCQSLGVDAD